MTSWTRVKPAIGRIAVELMSQEERSAAGIWLPHQANEVSNSVGRVIETCVLYKSSDGEEGPLYNIGDIVAFGKYTGTRIQLNRKEVVVMKEMDILCTLHPDEATDAGERASGDSSGVIPIDRIR